MTPRATTFRSALAAFIIVILVAAPQAQQAQSPQFASAGTATPAPPARGPATGVTDIDLLVGRSTILNVGSPIARVSLTVPDIADAMVTAPGQLLIHGKAPGTISLFVWDRGGAITTYEVKVRRDLTALVEQVKQLFPGEPISIIGSGKDVVISGTVSSRYVVEKAASVAAGYVDKAENVVNLLKQQEGVASNQVMLRVRFAEVSRTAMTELGASLFTGAGGFHDYVARSTTQQFAAPGLEMDRLSTQGSPDKWGGGRDTVESTGGKATFSDFLNLFIFNNRYNIGAVVKALKDKGLFQSLAEPNLVATNGKEASFLAGGEFPIPVVQGSGAGNSVTVMFKEFGVRLSFTPTVLGGDLINLKVKPEVSSLDFGNAVTVNGFRIPALTTRRTETEVELRDGQTFAIAGLMNNTVTDSMRKIPGIGDIPILGWLFKSKSMQKNQTELVVMITPVIIRRGQMGASEGLPSLVEPYLGAPSKTMPNPDPHVGSPRYPANHPAPRSGAAVTQPSPAPTAAGSSAPALAARPVTRPIESSATLPLAGAPSRQAPSAPPVQTPALSKEESQALEQKREADRKAADAAARQKVADDRRKAEADIAAQKKAEEDKRAADKLAKERAVREAEVAKRNAEIARRKAEEDQRRDKSLNEAAARLKAAQAAYQAEIDKTKSAQK